MTDVKIANNKLAWEKLFKQDNKSFSEVHKDVINFVKLLKKNKVKKVLDLGSGTGRHVVYLAKNNFETYGIDISKSGISESLSRLNGHKLKANLLHADITKKLPYKDNFFDALVSTQVIHHAEKKIVYKIIDEITRIIKGGGLVFITVPTYKRYSKKHSGWKMKRIATRTFSPLNGPEEGLIHYFFTPKELEQVFSKKFEVIESFQDSTNHWCIIAKKK